MLLTAPFATFSVEIFRSLLFSGFFLLPAWTTFWVTLAAMGMGRRAALTLPARWEAASADALKLVPPAESSFRNRSAVKRRKCGSPAVVPYCRAARPLLGEAKISLSNSRASSTGSDSLSVNPAASEIKCGRSSVNCISHEIGGASVR